MTNVKLRDVLDGIVRTYMNMAWEIHYYGDVENYSTSQISFRSYEGWTITAGPRPNRK